MKKRSVPAAIPRRQHPVVEWLNLASFLCAWAAREHRLNLQALWLAPVEPRGQAGHRAERHPRVS